MESQKPSIGEKIDKPKVQFNSDFIRQMQENLMGANRPQEPQITELKEVLGAEAINLVLN